MLERYQHWSPLYVRDRLALRAYERRNPDAPWLTAAMIELLTSWLKPSDVGLEWGAGRSTIWLGRRVARLVSIEDNSDWAERVQQMIADADLGARVTLHRAPITASDKADPGQSRYIRLGQDPAADAFDFILVDGDLRDHCAAVAIDRLKPGGALIIDNVERYIPRAEKSRSPNARALSDGFQSPQWERVGALLASWRCVWTSNGVTDTALWIKPA